MGTVVITKRPLRLIYADSPYSAYSRWVAGSNPINYKFLFTDVDDRISLKIYEYGTNLLLSSSTHAPRPDKTMNLDIAEYANDYLYSTLQNITVRNKKDTGSTLKIYFTYVIYNKYEDPDTLSARTIYTEQYIAVTSSAMQFGDKYGSNMAKYLPFAFDAPTQYKSEMLTMFKEPVYFEGFPFTLSFIYNEDIASHEVHINESRLDVNKSLLSTVVSDLDTTQAGVINLLTLNTPTGENYIKFNLSVGDAIPQAYVESGYVLNGYVEIL